MMNMHDFRPGGPFRQGGAEDLHNDVRIWRTYEDYNRQ